MTNPSSRPLLLAVSAFAVMLVVAARSVGDAPRTGDSASPAAHAAVLRPNSSAEIECSAVAEPIAFPMRQLVAEPAPLATAVETQPRATPTERGTRLRPGRLAVQVLDSATGAPLKGVRVRAVDATRAADRTAGRREPAPMLRLTPRDYALYVSAPGYEPAELASVLVVADQTTTPAPIYLVPGSARIEGRVESSPATGTSWRAELVGAGRRPCARCDREPCPHCGFAEDETRVAVAADGSFAFERLASAVYMLRIVDADERECSTPSRIDLQPAQRSYTVLASAPPRTIRVALEDVDGVSLADAWAARVSHAAEPGFDGLEVLVSGQDITWSCEFRADGMRVGYGSFAPPAPTGANYFSSRMSSCGGCRRSGDRDDRLRLPAEDLRPAPIVPTFAQVQFQPSVDTRGHVLVEGVPARVDSIEMTHGKFFALVAIGTAAENVQRARMTVERGASESTFREHEASLIDRATKLRR